jgi:class 3 adenylate cyclase
MSKQAKYSLGIIESSYFLGSMFITQNNTASSIEYYFISMKKSEKEKNLKGLAKAQMGIGLVYYNQNNWLKAVEYFKQSLATSKKIKDYHRVAMQEYLIGLSLTSMKRYPEAKVYLDNALQAKIALKDTSGIYETYLGIANVYKGLKQFDSAESYYNKVLPMMMANNEYHPISMIYASFAEMACAKKDFRKALPMGLKGYAYAERFINASPKLYASKVLFNIYKELGDDKNALKYNLIYTSIKDSVENRDFASQASVAQTTYDFEKREAAINSEQEKKDLEYQINLKNETTKKYIFIGIALLSLMFIVAIFFAYRSLKEQKKISENLLLNILPKDTTLELKQYGKAISKNHNGVSIMFCDVKDFTLIAEKLTPEQVVEMLDFYFQQFDTIAETYKLEKIKTIGDAYMCVCGLNQDIENTAVNTIQAAMEFLKFSESVQAEMESKFNHSFKFRVGINTGNVVSGVVGKHKYSYDIWGDAVNIAARMEQNSVPGMINITGNSYVLVKDSFKCSYRGKIDAKNKGEIDMYFVESVI